MGGGRGRYVMGSDVVLRRDDDRLRVPQGDDFLFGRLRSPDRAACDLLVEAAMAAHARPPERVRRVRTVDPTAQYRFRRDIPQEKLLLSNGVMILSQILRSGRSVNAHSRFFTSRCRFCLASVLQATSTRKQASPGLRSSASGEAEDSSPEEKTRVGSHCILCSVGAPVWLPIDRGEA